MHHTESRQMNFCLQSAGFGFDSMKDNLLKQKLGKLDSEVTEKQMELETLRGKRLNLMSKNLIPLRTDDIVSAEFTSYDMTKSCMEQTTSKYSEITRLREELIRAKNVVEDERAQKEKFQEKLKDLEMKLNNICSGAALADPKELRRYETENSLLKSHIRDLKEEIEELKLMATENGEQFHEYRVKYLQAQQEAEEYKRQITIFNQDSKQVSDHVQVEIQKMKIQFQEKIQELSPLPDVLKGAQIQLQEAKQLQTLAEESSQQLSNELHRVNEKLIITVNNYTQEKAEKQKILCQYESLMDVNVEKLKEIDELVKTIDDYKFKVTRLEEKLSHLDLRYNEKALEYSTVVKDLEELRMESGRALARAKERSDSMRRFLQANVSELERHMIQCRAECRTYQKQRDEIRQNVQQQVNNLKESYDFTEIRLRGLQKQVASLKNSYSLVLEDEDDSNDLKITPVP